MQYKHLTIVGTSHIAAQSLEDVRMAFDSIQPDIVALELDIGRAAGLMSKKKQRITLSDIRRIGLKGYLFAVFAGWIEKKLGSYVGVAPGSEMVQAIRLARKRKLPVLYIDQDIAITLRRISRELGWAERFRFLADLFKGLVFRRDIVKIDLTKVPERELITTMMKALRKRYPSLYKVLVVERNAVMAQRLSIIMQKNPDKKILAIVGAGHEEDIIGILKRVDLGRSLPGG